MTVHVGFFTVLRTDPNHFLHAASLVADVRRVMPGCEIVQLTDENTPVVNGVTSVYRGANGPLLARRMEAYGQSYGDWILLDTDVSVRADVRDVFDDKVFDVALTDRHWPHLAQGDEVMHTMPFNTGVVFSRAIPFWYDTLGYWQRFDDAKRANWMSEQWAVYETVRSGKYRVKILPGMIYNYPPKSADDRPAEAKILHYKGPRKTWLSQHATTQLGAVCVSA